MPVVMELALDAVLCEAYAHVGEESRRATLGKFDERHHLVAKEYVAVQSARGCHGVLLLSEFTGAATELKDAVLCNPFDVDRLSSLIEHALALPSAARRRAMTAMARRVTTHDVHRWVDAQLSDIFAGAG